MSSRRIDWRAVQFVCEGEKLRLSVEEKRMVIRRMEHRLLCNGDSIWTCTASKITADELAERMHTSARSVQRIRELLPHAHKRTCPDCGEPMWVYDDGTVEAHPRRTLEQCGFSKSWLVIA